MQSEVFRPSTGPLLVRGAINEGPAMSMDMFRKKDHIGSRPSTQGGYRFGQLSHNSFFARHNPHPGRVRHIKGLLDVPICSVNDDGFFANPRYSLNFPPNNFDQNKILNYTGPGQKAPSMPVNAINVNSTKHPINSITGLQNFLGKPLNFRVFREKAVPRMGMVPMTDAWRDELRALTEAVGIAPGNQLPKPPMKPMTAGRPRTTQYSAQTGRLIPPPSRAMSRGPSRAGSRGAGFSRFQHITEEPDSENMVLQMLCQILQTDDINAVQSWLCSAGDREKAMVLDMIKSAITNSDDYYKQSDAIAEERPGTGLINNVDVPAETLGASGQLDRLTLDGGSPPPQLPNTVGVRPFPDITEAQEEEVAQPLLPDVFQKTGGMTNRPKSSASVKAPTPLGDGEIKLRYTTPNPRHPPASPNKMGLTSFMDDDAVWQPDLSV